MCMSATKYKFPHDLLLKQMYMECNVRNYRCLYIAEEVMYFKSSAEISVVHQKLHTWFKVIASLESKFNTQNIALQLSKSFSSQTTNYLTKI